MHTTDDTCAHLRLTPLDTSLYATLYFEFKGARTRLRGYVWGRRVTTQSGVALPICASPLSRCTCRFRCPPCLGGLEQRLKVLGTGVGRDLDDEALPRVVSLNLLEDPGEVKVGYKWGWVWGRGAVGGGGGSRGRVGEEARIGAKARGLRDGLSSRTKVRVWARIRFRVRNSGLESWG